MKVQNLLFDSKNDHKNEIVLTRGIYLSREIDIKLDWKTEMLKKKRQLTRNKKRQAIYW